MAHRTRHRGLLLAIGLSPLLLGGKCSPSLEEAGAAVLLTAPVALGVTALVLWGLSTLFRPAVPALAVRWRPVRLAVLAWLAVGLVVALPIAPRAFVWTWVPMAHATYGACVLAWSLLVWRIWIRKRPADAFVGAPLYVHLLLTLPALPMSQMRHVPSPDGGVWEPVMMTWVFTGFLGIPAGVVLLVLIAEGVVRRRRAARLE
ncbi:MAG: hypothetical protein FJ102_26710 [Deltaproteobacteria bacterium]|nr:hypothetical protein [Deltaproteobacteria bacterium]